MGSETHVLHLGRPGGGCLKLPAHDWLWSNLHFLVLSRCAGCNQEGGLGLMQDLPGAWWGSNWPNLVDPTVSIYSLWSAQTLFILSTFSGELEDSKLALEFCGVLFLSQIKEPLARIQKWKFKWQVSFEFHLLVSFSALPPPASPWPLLRIQELSEDKREPLCAVGATVLPPLKCRAVCSWRHWPWMHRPPPQLVSASTVPGLGSPSHHRVCAPESLQVLPSKVSSSSVISSFPLSLFAANKSGPYRTIGTWLARKITITKSHKSQNSQPKMLQSYIPPDHPVMIRGFMSNLAGRVPCPYVSMGKGEGPGDSEMVALPASSIWWIQQPHWSRMSLCAGGDPAVRRLRPCGPQWSYERCWWCFMEPQKWSMEWNVGIGMWPPQTHLFPIPFEMISWQSRPRRLLRMPGLSELSLYGFEKIMELNIAPSVLRSMYSSPCYLSSE